MADFPTKPMLSQGESPSMYDNQAMSVAIKAPTDGGYEFRRNRTTRPRRRVIKTGFRGLPHADYLILKAFEEAKTDVVGFTYFDYILNVTYQVRFDEFKPSYVGIGTNRIWDIAITMSEI